MPLFCRDGKKSAGKTFGMAGRMLVGQEKDSGRSGGSTFSLAPMSSPLF
jgi:hypothetical protein